jgi:hypothetical protein
MKLSDFATQIIVTPAKFTTYALNANHPTGKHKARVFASVLGYTVENYQQLLKQIELQAFHADAKEKHQDQYGRHFQVDLTIVGTAGNKAVVRTGWLIPINSYQAFLTTAYVL